MNKGAATGATEVNDSCKYCDRIINEVADNAWDTCGSEKCIEQAVEDYGNHQYDGMEWDD